MSAPGGSTQETKTVDEVSHEIVSKSFSGVRGILKKKSTDDKGSRSGIQWDEETIAEHDKERGTRMKIDEPNTPFHYFDSNEEFADDGTTMSGNDLMLPDAVMEAREGTDAAAQQRMDKRKLTQEKAEAGKVNPDELFSRLEQVANRTDGSPSNVNGEMRRLGSQSRSVHLSAEFEWPDERPKSQEEIEKKKKFEQMRKAHYNEFQKMQELRRSGSLDDDDDDEKVKLPNKETDKRITTV